MRLRTLHLLAYGKFTDQILHVGDKKTSLSLVYGPNEAGKSTTLDAITDLRFGFPQKSQAGFLHSNQALRIGGVFVDENDEEHALIRRKGRGDTLLFADFSQVEPMSDIPASAELVRKLDAGLDRNTYLQLFGIDRDRMQQGGRNIFDAGGDIGAVLFEASSGSSSVPAILKRFTDESRKLYLPSGNAKNAAINQSLQAYRDARQRFDEAETRPMVWTRLRRDHDDAASTLSALEKEHIELREQQGLARELLAVRPLLSQIDHERRRLEELADVPLLSDKAESERHTMASDIAGAAAQAEEEELVIQQLTQRLATPIVDEALLARGRSIRRALASLENLDRLRREAEVARRAEVEADEDRRRFAAGIATGKGVEDVLGEMPTPAQQADIRTKIELVSAVTDKLDEHRQRTVDNDESGVDGIDTTLPDESLRTSLADLRTELITEGAALQRLRNIPAERKALDRLIVKALDVLGLDDPETAKRIRPFTDAEIDAAIQQRRDFDDRQQRMTDERRRLQTEKDEATQQRQQILQHGDVTTLDDVRQARRIRDAEWSTVRGNWLSPDTSSIPPAERTVAADRFDTASRHADDSADRLARNAEQATLLHQAELNLGRLDGRLVELDQLAARHAHDTDELHTRWHDTLRQGGVPLMSPAELGKWQVKLQDLCEQLEASHRLEDEYAELSRLEQNLAGRLRTALQTLGEELDAAESSVKILAGKAERLERELAQREKDHIDTVARRAEREQQRTRHAAEGKELTVRCDAAVSALSGAFVTLSLPADTSIAAALARLEEIRQLAEQQAHYLACQRTRQSADNDLETLTGTIKELQRALDDPPEDDLSHYADTLLIRLETAEKMRDDRLRAEEAVAASQKRLIARQSVLARQREAQTRLCEQAGVETPDLLVARIAESTRKRDAREKLDTALRQLREASPQRDESPLRSLLSNRSAADLEAEESRCLQALSIMQERLDAARGLEERTRRDLQAIDASDEAAQCAEAMEQAASSVAAQVPVWVRLRVAGALLDEALRRFRERAQAPMLTAASAYFERMTDGEYRSLFSSDTGAVGSLKAPTLVARRNTGDIAQVGSLSEGTRDQLYLALRLAAVDLRRESGIDMPLVLDDVLMSSDDHRSSLILQALYDFAEHNQVIILTHHEHVVRIAADTLSGDRMTQVALP